MNVLFVSDFSLAHNSGGAQVSNELIIQEGLSRGHTITEFNYDSPAIKLIDRYDVIINSNLEAIYKNRPNVFHWLMRQDNMSRLEHDSCQYFHPEDRQRIFSASRINFFLSQHHLDYFKRDYGDYFENTRIVVDPIDTKRFKDLELERTIDVVYCGFIHPLKGFKNLIQYARKNPKQNIEVYGWGDQGSITSLTAEPNITFKGKANYNDIPKIFNTANFVYHSPLVEEPFCRMIGEAMLCGCGIIGAVEKIGSYQECKRIGDEAFRKACDTAEETFWKEIEECYQ